VTDNKVTGIAVNDEEAAKFAASCIPSTPVAPPEPRIGYVVLCYWPWLQGWVAYSAIHDTVSDALASCDNSRRHQVVRVELPQ
jgi:hypothetical protein